MFTWDLPGDLVVETLCYQCGPGDVGACEGNGSV